MKIAIDISPLDSIHAARGIGQYTLLLKEGLTKFDNKNTYSFFSGKAPSGVDMVHYPYFDIFVNSLSVKKGVKTVVTIHDLIPLKFPEHFPKGIKGTINWYLQQKSLKKVSGILTDSHASASDIQAIAAVSPEKIHTVYLSVSPSYRVLQKSELTFLDLDNKYSVPQKYLLYVGDVNWNKNVMGLLEAFALLKKNKSFTDLKLVLVGSALQKNIPESNEVRNTIKRLDLEESIVMPGFVEEHDLVGIYNRAALYVQPSFYEGFGLSNLEAMSCGTVVASSRVGSLPEVAGEAAAYFDPYDVHDIVRVIGGLLTDKEKVKRKIAEGLHQAEKFTQEMFIRNTVRVYEKVVQSS